MNELVPGTTVLAADGKPLVVDDALAAAFRPGDRLIADPVAGLLHIPATASASATTAVDAAVSAFAAMHEVADERIAAFFDHAAAALEDDAVWRQVAEVNAADVEDARRRGRSTTRLRVSDAMRANMAAGLRGWSGALRRRAAAPCSKPSDTTVSV